ncbi:sensor histidine kinase [uncultured Friedmanniella sp.]|uniref:sensor histidine kinase n=1 Tax=uncultured Friedmanniella sp. TaxID=335381 RepID=UPI0035C9EA7E
MRTPQLPRAAQDAALGVGVAVLALSTAQLNDFDARQDRGGHRGPPLGPRRTEHAGPAFDASQLAAVVALVAALALRRTFPRVAYAGVLVAVAAFLWAGGSYGLVLLGPVLAVHTLMTRFPPRQLGLMLLGVPAAMSAGFWGHPYGGLNDPGLYLAVVLGTAGILLPGLLALVLATRRDAERHDRLAERRRYADEERLQIAREVHDVVGHSLAVINMQAGVALHLLERRPDQLGPSLEAIRSTSKTALAELGSTLATLRGDPPEGAEAVVVEPPTGLAGLDNLVSALQAAGREVRYTRPPADRLQLPVAVQHAALRIAQEGLTNVVRHATADASITVTLTREGPLLVVEVLDDGRRGRGGYAEGSGIAGIRSRAGVVGGLVVVGPLPDSGFRVRAELPVGDLPGGTPLDAAGRSA